jgi:hypothetical protein
MKLFVYVLGKGLIIDKRECFIKMKYYTCASTQFLLSMLNKRHSPSNSAQSLGHLEVAALTTIIPKT